ncbi:hypothetical protein ACROYT_G014886 [Oculina patagonica]
MVDRAHRLSSTEEAFTKECNKLRTMFSKLHYPNVLVDSTIRKFRQETNTEPHAATPSEPSVYISLPFKDQRSANRVRKEIHSLGSKINIDVKPVFTSRKLSQILCVKENKPPIVNTQCVVYLFQCDLCDANYVGFTARHLHQRISEHRYSAIGRHLEAQHGSKAAKINHLFKVLKKCRSKKDQAHVRCLQCGLKDIMCAKCDDDVHRRSPFHDRDIYHEEFFKPVAPSVSLDSEGLAKLL